MNFNQKVKDFIENNVQSDTHELALKNRQLEPSELKIALEQIESRQRIKTKLPSWCRNFDLILPNSKYLEQSSSEKTAFFKSQIYQFKTSIDCTGGTGVDSAAIAINSERHLIIENNADLAELLKHNFSVLNLKNVEIVAADCIEYLNKSGTTFDFAYVDPSRRQSGKRVFKLDEMTPDLAVLLPILSKKANKIMIKLSPLFDIEEILRYFKNIEFIHVVAVNNECKEILVSLNSEMPKEPQIVAVELGDSKNFVISGTLNKAPSSYEMPKKYIYEANVALVKLGKYFDYQTHYGIYEIGVNTNLYTSELQTENFAGEVFELIAITKPNAKELENILGNQPKAMLKVRNFPMKTEDLRKKLNLLEGDEYKIFAVTLCDGSKKFLICRKISID
ncbi:MAG: class I SAM-dependent methyltransferase [Candidatus Kapabacteria bacterium]|nr:class I SAM-dependent methyltransferase [Candidatus Kapabacteria bacterium]